MARDPARREFAVFDSKGQTGIVIASVNHSHSSADPGEPQLVYGMGGLVVEKISEFEFRDFRGAIWTTRDAGSNS